VSDRAGEWLAAAVRLHDPGLLFLKTDPFLDPVRTSSGSWRSSDR